jgi:hypothetical protein
VLKKENIFLSLGERAKGWLPYGRPRENFLLIVDQKPANKRVGKKRAEIRRGFLGYPAKISVLGEPPVKTATLQH